MYFTFTEVGQDECDGQIQKTFNVDVFDNAEKTNKVESQTAIVSGDALNDVEAWFTANYGKTVEANPNNYIIKRQTEYPTFADQFDILYHEGYDAWKATIQAVKDKYPKPEGS